MCRAANRSSSSPAGRRDPLAARVPIVVVHALAAIPSLALLILAIRWLYLGFAR